ncbi:diacylglycerol kinase [uncultured Cocleimonas sp.]|uniref:diacylglycerol kinase n=1 Tax=uncultured Cocleimonas sp. TaxID=1051587 RepID=UPI00261BDC13|nr:diacylglycerol kinase [uncultured Cocleimonas sp.]
MAGSGNTGITRWVKALGFTWLGLKATYKHEEAFRQEVWLLVVSTPIALWFGETGIEKALLIGSVLLLLIVELLNSAIEAVVDRFGGEHHELSGRAKDMGSAAVFVAMMNTAIVWLFVLWP